MMDDACLLKERQRRKEGRMLGKEKGVSAMMRKKEEEGWVKFHTDEFNLIGLDLIVVVGTMGII